MAELRDHLQATLGDGYTLEQELGGGGMSRVFVAQESALGRKGKNPSGCRRTSGRQPAEAEVMLPA